MDINKLTVLSQIVNGIKDSDVLRNIKHIPVNTEQIVGVIPYLVAKDILFQGIIVQCRTLVSYAVPSSPIIAVSVHRTELLGFQAPPSYNTHGHQPSLG